MKRPARRWVQRSPSSMTKHHHGRLIGGLHRILSSCLALGGCRDTRFRTTLTGERAQERRWIGLVVRQIEPTLLGQDILSALWTNLMMVEAHIATLWTLHGGLLKGLGRSPVISRPKRLIYHRPTVTPSSTGVIRHGCSRNSCCRYLPTLTLRPGPYAKRPASMQYMCHDDSDKRPGGPVLWRCGVPRPENCSKMCTKNGACKMMWSTDGHKIAKSLSPEFKRLDTGGPDQATFHRPHEWPYRPSLRGPSHSKWRAPPPWSHPGEVTISLRRQRGSFDPCAKWAAPMKV